MGRAVALDLVADRPTRTRAAPSRCPCAGRTRARRGSARCSRRAARGRSAPCAAPGRRSPRAAATCRRRAPSAAGRRRAPAPSRSSSSPSSPAATSSTKSHHAPVTISSSNSGSAAIVRCSRYGGGRPARAPCSAPRGTSPRATASGPCRCHASKSSGWAVKTSRAIAVRAGFCTPRNGISDFMYACMSGAFVGIGAGGERRLRITSIIAAASHAARARPARAPRSATTSSSSRRAPSTRRCPSRSASSPTSAARCARAASIASWPRGGQLDQPRAGVVRVGRPLHVAAALEVGDRLGDRLLRHAEALRQRADRHRAADQVLEDEAVGEAEVVEAVGGEPPLDLVRHRPPANSDASERSASAGSNVHGMIFNHGCAYYLQPWL